MSSVQRRCALVPPPPPVLKADTNHVKHALHSVPYNPQPQRHSRRFVPAQYHHRRRRHHEREVPNDVQDHHRLRIRPIALPLLQLLRRRLTDHHRRLAHHPPAARLPEEPRRLAEALPPYESAAGIEFFGGAAAARIPEKRRRIDDVLGRTRRGPCGRHVRKLGDWEA